MDEFREALEESQLQIDDKGAMVGVNRWALNETLRGYDALRSQLAAMVVALDVANGIVREYGVITCHEARKRWATVWIGVRNGPTSGAGDTK